MVKLDFDSQGITFHRELFQLPHRILTFSTSGQLKAGQISSWHRNLADNAVQVHDFPVAVHHYERALNIDPEDMEVWNNLAELQMDTLLAFVEVGLPTQHICNTNS